MLTGTGPFGRPDVPYSPFRKIPDIVARGVVEPMVRVLGKVRGVRLRLYCISRSLTSRV